MRYNEVLDNLQKSINQKGLTLLFAQSIKDFREHFGAEISTKFLRGLSDLEDTRKKTKRISYLMSKNKLKTIRISNIYKVRGVSKYKTSVITWGHDKSVKPFPAVVGLTDDEKRQIAEVKAFSEKTGVDLFDHATSNLNDRQKRRNAFNYGGGAVVRDVKVVQIGSYGVTHRSEVLYIVR